MGCPGIRRERRAPGKMLDDRLTEQIRVPSSRQAARETGRVLPTAAQLAALVSPDRKRLVEICNGLPGVKPVAQSTHRKMASKRIRKVLRKFGEPRGRPDLKPSRSTRALRLSLRANPQPLQWGGAAK